MKRRFQSFNSVSHFFKCLQPISLSELNDEKLNMKAEILQKKYDHNISPDFVHQIRSFRSCFKDIIFIKHFMYTILCRKQQKKFQKCY